MFAIIIVQIIGQIMLKGNINELFGMFFTLQIVCYMKFYAIPVPSNTSIYRD